MKKLAMMMVAMIIGIGTALAGSGVDWSLYEFVGDGAGGGAYSNKYKVQTVDGLSVVNIQQPGFATEAGIYVTVPAAISNCTVACDIQGAGVVLYLSAFTDLETEVTLEHGLGTTTFWVYYADGYAGDVALQGVSLPENADVYVGKTITLAPTFTPANATNKNVSWSTSDASVATVAEGVVTGVAEGTAVITVTTEEGNYTAECTVTVGTAPASEPTTWTGADVSVAVGCPTWISQYHGGDKANMTDGNIDGTNCQLAVSNEHPVEWVVVDLGFNYDVTKVAVTTTGDRKDKKFAIYVAPAQAEAPAFADGTDALDGQWELAFEGDDNYTDVNFATVAYSVNLAGVRYVKYVGTERNHFDQWGTAICEISVAGTTDDPEAVKPDHFVFGTVGNFFVGETKAISFKLANVVGGDAEYEAANLEVATSDANVATAVIEGSNVKVTGVNPGNATVTLTYGTVTGSFDVEVAAAMTAAPVPAADAASVLSLYSDAYAAYDFGWYDWGGCTLVAGQIGGDNYMGATKFKYCGSQFAVTDVTAYNYFHIDVYSTVATTVGIVPITQQPEGGNSPERGVYRELVAMQWNSFDIPMSEFVAAGVTNLQLLYQLKFNGKIVGADQWNGDGTYDLFFDNIYFYTAALEAPEFTVAASNFSYEAATKQLTVNYAIDQTKAGDVKHYHVWVVELPAAASSKMRVAAEGEVVGELNHTDLENLNGSIVLSDVESGAHTYAVRAQAVLTDDSVVNPTGYEGTQAGAAENETKYTYDTVSGNTTTSLLESLSVDSQVAVEYFTLQGVKVANPSNGLYIRRQGTTVSKVYIK